MLEMFLNCFLCPRAPTYSIYDPTPTPTPPEKKYENDIQQWGKQDLHFQKETAVEQKYSSFV